MKLKTCPKCKITKPIAEFNKTKITKDGLQSWCSNCRKMYRQFHKEEKKEYDKKYRQAHKEEKKKYREIHKKERKKLKRKYEKTRKKTDINYRLLCNLRSRICKALKRNTKSLSTMFLIGCSVEYLMYYLQCKFTKGMAWDTYGKWHIDHIRPCATFDLSTPSEQRKCFNYTNLQPLWATDNLQKGNKYNK